MTPLAANAFAGLCGLLIFFLFFVALLAWLFRPGAKAKYEQDARIALKD